MPDIVDHRPPALAPEPDPSARRASGVADAAQSYRAAGGTVSYSVTFRALFAGGNAVATTLRAPSVVRGTAIKTDSITVGR